MIDDGNHNLAPYGANGDTVNSPTAGPESGKDFADPTLPAEVGGAGPQAGGDSPYRAAEVEADCATNASPARGNTTMGTQCAPSREGIAGTEWDSGPKLPTRTDEY